MRALFGGPPPKSPAEQAKDWKRQLGAEGRKMEHQIRKIQQAEMKAVKSAKQAAKMGDNVSVRILAKEILQARKAATRLRTAKTQMNSVALQLQMQVSQQKLAGSLQKSTEVMTAMNGLIKIGEVSNTMREMSKEMTKAGLIDEMMTDAIDTALDDGIEEEELDDEVAKVVKEVVMGQMQGAKVSNAALPTAQQQVAVAEEPVPEDDEDEDELMAKYNALKAGA